jgi:hypothetical protein
VAVTTARELILTRLESAVGAIAPGFAFEFPGARPHAPLSTVIKSVTLRERAILSVEAEQMPCAVIVADMTKAETLRVADGSAYLAEMAVTVLGFASADDAGDSLDSALRPKLNAMRADLEIACHAAQFWPTPSSPDALGSLLGSGFGLRLVEQWTDNGLESAMGLCVLEFLINYPIDGSKRH